jgi:alkyl hydroperoxide reductase subunit F
MAVEEQKAYTEEYNGEVYFFCSSGCRERFLNERFCKLPRTTYDLIIIGGGPGGLTAAIYAATLRMDAFLIAKDLGGQAIDSTKISNYMGFDFITGPELVGKFQYQLIHSHYIDHLITDVERVEPVEGGFHVTTSELIKFFAPTLIISTGMSRRRLNVPGEEELQRRGVFYGNMQDFSFVYNQDVAVIGGGNSALQMVESLHKSARNIHLISDRELTADSSEIEKISRFENVYKYEGYKVMGFKGTDTLSGISIRKKASEKSHLLSVKGVFIAIGLQPNSSVVSHLTDCNEKREIVIKPDCSTSYPGIFAAGDVTNAFGKRIIIASGEGAKAALAARQYLVNLKKNHQ